MTERTQDQPMRAWQHVDNTYRTLNELIDVDLPDCLQQRDLIRAAVLASFLVNVRLIAEFLVRPSTGHRGIKAADFAPDWIPPDIDAAHRLYGDWWTIASQEVVHLSDKQLSDLPDCDIDQVLVQMRDDIRTVWNDYLAFRRGKPDTTIGRIWLS